MKIALTATEPNLSAQVDPRFGRCPYFLFVDSETMEFEAVENPNVGAMGGAGIQSAQLVANKGVQAVLTGSCGPNAFQTLQTAGVQVIIGVVGTIRDAIERYKSGQLNPAANPNVPSHFGVGPGQPMRPGSGPEMGGGFRPGMGGGFGRGMGGGMGRGMGGGWGQAMAYPTQPPGMTPPQAPIQQELSAIRQQTELLCEQIETMNKRITKLENKK